MQESIESLRNELEERLRFETLLAEISTNFINLPADQVDSDNMGSPTSLTKNLDFKDTWHFAGGAQYHMSDAWLLNFGAAYDSKFQGDSTVSPMLPVNDAWRFGAGAIS
jgi:long-subunit fatty acid transport protein